MPIENTSCRTQEDIFDKLMHRKPFAVFEPFYKNHKEALLYIFFGGLAFVLNFTIFALLDLLGMDELINNCICWVICVYMQFHTNRIWVFNQQITHQSDYGKQLSSFFCGRVFTLVIEEIILAVFILWLGFNALVIKLIAQIVVIVLNYVISKLFVFR